MTREGPVEVPFHGYAQGAMPLDPLRGRPFSLFSSPSTFFGTPHRFEEATAWALAATGLVGVLSMLGGDGFDLASSLATLEGVVAGVGSLFLFVAVTLHVVLKLLGGRGSFEDTYAVLVFVGSAAVTGFLVPLASLRLLLISFSLEPSLASLPLAALALGGTVVIWACIVTWIGLLRVHEVGPSSLALALLLVFAPIIARMGMAMTGSEGDGTAAMLSLAVPVGLAVIVGSVYLVGLLISMRDVS